MQLDASPAPLILTLDLGTEFARFDALRRRHFPAAINRIPAHATLFHHLPGSEEAAVRETLAALVRPEAPPEIEVSEVRFLGRGVAFGLRSVALTALRAKLAQAFEPWLTAQDRQGWRPHVTVQNKVAPEQARALHATLARDFESISFAAPALNLWHYRGGPWERCAAFAFGGAG